jgi:hypothetical protein
MECRTFDALQHNMQPHLPAANSFVRIGNLGQAWLRRRLPQATRWAKSPTSNLKVCASKMTGMTHIIGAQRRRAQGSEISAGRFRGWARSIQECS